MIRRIHVGNIVMMVIGGFLGYPAKPNRTKVIFRSTLLFCLLFSLVDAARGQDVLATFTIEDHLNRAWTNELVFYPVSSATWGRKEVSLVGPDGKSVPRQWATADHSPNGKVSVAFLATVPEFGKTSYSLVTGAAAGTEDELLVTDSAKTLELTNAHIGLRLHRGEKALSDGPIAGLRLPSGAWIGGGSIKKNVRPTKHNLEITAKGPVFFDASVSYEFGDQGKWQLRFRLVRGESVVLVDESCDAPTPSIWRLSLAEGWNPTRILYRNEKAIAGSTFGQQESCPIGHAADGQPAFVLEPWLHWNYRARQGNWFSVYGDANNDMLMVGAVPRRVGSM